MTKDLQFDQVSYRLSEIEHRYGPNIKILSNPFLLSHLGRLCGADTTQPVINELVTTIYLALLQVVVSHEFPQVRARIETRMSQTHPKEAFYDGPVIDPESQVVCVNLARAGTLPSHICYNALNYFLNPKRVRQDHISISRSVNPAHEVTGSAISGHKIGGRIDHSFLLFPDPMGATGSTIVEAMDLYRSQGRERKAIALHCIITPEYIARIQARYPDLLVYAVRLDRGLSPPEVLRSIPGTHRDKEKGLNSHHYIVPGGGGFGEVFNNSYV